MIKSILFVFALFAFTVNCQTKIMLIADTHITIPESESKYNGNADRMNAAYCQYNAPMHFQNLMKIAISEKVDYIFLLGDIVNNPSKASVYFVKNELDKIRIIYYFISGNHDWDFEGLNFNKEQQRDEWINSVLLPLYSGCNPLYYSVLINGINFVFIDNSTGQISSDQLFFLKCEVMKCNDIILLMHIPIYSEEIKQLDFTIGNPIRNNTQTTIDFIRYIKETVNIKRIIAGHCHRESEQNLTECLTQTTIGMGLLDKYLIIKLIKKAANHDRLF